MGEGEKGGEAAEKGGSNERERIFKNFARCFISP